MKWCTYCGRYQRSMYDKYKNEAGLSGSDDQCISCARYTLTSSGPARPTTPEGVIKLSALNIACGQRIEPYSSETHYCQRYGCHNRVYQGSYCSEHRPTSSSINWGYSYSSSSSICQTEDCSRQTTSSSQSYCQLCQQTQSLIRRVENRTSIRQVKDAEEFSAWWNNNLATVINGDGSFAIWLLVYDDKDSRIRDFQTSSNHYGLSNAKNQAFNVKR